MVPFRLDTGARLPDPEDIDAVLAMGGPMSVNDPLPWIRREKEFIRRAVDRGIPFFGVCLGAQLLASAFGASVRPAQAHYGMHTAHLAQGAFDDPVFGGLPRSLRVFQWHGENFGLPAGATRLADSPGCPNEAIRIGATAYAVQFHLELDLRLLAEWLDTPACASELTRSFGPDGVDRVTAQLMTEAVRLERYARRVFGGWVDLVARRAPVTSP